MLTNKPNEIALEELIKLSGRYLSYKEVVELIPSSLSDQITAISTTPFARATTEVKQLGN